MKALAKLFLFVAASAAAGWIFGSVGKSLSGGPAKADAPLVARGPFQLLQLIEDRSVRGPVEGGVRKLWFPDLPWNAEGYEPRYSAVMTTQVEGAKVGDLLDIRSAVTVEQRPFTDFRTNKPGSAFVPNVLCITDAIPDDGPKLPGIQLWPGSGENIDDGRHYYQPQRQASWVVTKTPVFVSFVLGPASQGGRKGQFLSIPTTSSYCVQRIWHYRPL